MTTTSMMKFGCPNCGTVFKMANKEQWVCPDCYARFWHGMKKWRASPTQNVVKPKQKRKRGRPPKEK